MKNSDHQILIADTPEAIQAFNLLALRSALKLEIQGILVTRGRKASQIIKKRFDLHGRDLRMLLAEFETILRNNGVLASSTGSAEPQE